MRLLSVHNRYQVRGGEDESREAEERLLRELGHDVDVYEEDNHRVAELGKARTALRTIWSRQTYRDVRRVLSGGTNGYHGSHGSNGNGNGSHSDGNGNGNGNGRAYGTHSNGNGHARRFDVVHVQNFFP